MRRLITSILLICLVLGNLEVLTDFDIQHAGGGPASPFGHETVGGPDGQIPHDDSDCDHCCHGVAHFVGLVALSQRTFSQTPDRQPPLFSGIHESPVFAPPLQPPNV